jgi:hypothetical protein
MTESVRKTVVNRRLDHEISRDYLAVGLALVAVSFAAGARPTADWLDRLSGVPNLAFLVHGLSAMAAMVCVAGFVRSLHRSPVRVRTAATLFMVCALVQVGLFLAGGVTDPDFGSTAGNGAASRIYTLIYLTYMVSWIAMFIGSAFGAAQQETGEVKAGVLLAVAGMSIAVVGLAGRLLLTVTGLVFPSLARFWAGIAVVAEAGGVVIFAAGSAFAAATRTLRDRHDRARRVRQHASIEELWRRLEMVRADIVSFGDGEYPDLHQQLVEVLDARLILRPYVSPPLRALIVESAHEHAADSGTADLIAEAAEVRIAADAYRDRNRDVGVDIDVDARPERGSVYADVDDDVAHVAAIADLLTTHAVDAVVQLVRARCDLAR